MKTDLTPEERQRRLTQASKDYVHGRISAEEFEHAECLYRPNYIEAAAALLRARMSPGQGRVQA